MCSHQRVQSETDANSLSPNIPRSKPVRSVQRSTHAGEERETVYKTRSSALSSPVLQQKKSDSQQSFFPNEPEAFSIEQPPRPAFYKYQLPAPQAPDRNSTCGFSLELRVQSSKLDAALDAQTAGGLGRVNLGKAQFETTQQQHSSHDSKSLLSSGLMEVGSCTQLAARSHRKAQRRRVGKLFQTGGFQVGAQRMHPTAAGAAIQSDFIAPTEVSSCISDTVGFLGSSVEDLLPWPCVRTSSAQGCLNHNAEAVGHV